jgi:prepilin-type N-terminal cleavage/methylation domain-containing protein
VTRHNLPIGFSSSGLTLIELLVAVSVLGAAAVGILPGLAVASRVARLLDRQSKAYFFACSKLDEVRLASMQGVPLEEKSSGVFRAGIDRIDWQMTVVPIAADVQLQTVTLDMSWPRDQGKDSYQVRAIVRLLGNP